MSKRTLTRRVLALFVASIIVNAVLGIWALLAGDFGETQGKVLGTSFMVSAAMLGVLVNTPAAQRRVLWPAPPAGAAAAVVGFALFIALMWGDVSDDRWSGFKLAGSLLVVAAALTLSSNLALISAHRTMRGLPPVAHALIAALALTILFGIWGEPGDGWYARILGVEAVLVAAVALIWPVVARFAAPRGEPSEARVLAAVRYCPSCGHPVGTSPPGFGVTLACGACGLRFRVIDAGGTPPVD